MNRKYEVFPIGNLKEFKLQMLNWASRFNICAFLDSHDYDLPHQSQSGLVAVGSIADTSSIQNDSTGYFEALQVWAATQNDWIFGHLSFELAAITEKVSVKTPNAGFPSSYFYVPEIVVELIEEGVRIGSTITPPSSIYKEIVSVVLSENKAIQQQHTVPRFTAVIAKEEYLRRVQALQAHIKQGDCYEINFCQEFSATIPQLDPVAAFIRLQGASPAPFAAFYKWHEHYALCASPERYIKHTNGYIFSQPMKGTSKRNHEDAVQDILQKLHLENDPKERAENIIVVDLVRNDLSKIAASGSVEVEELCGVYAFPQVYQMTSTIKAIVKAGISWPEIIKATFPMGSMTGAPKKKVLELTTRYEATARGIYSGSIGYVQPNGDFDFNVVIRSLIYNKTTGKLSYHVGSGITMNAVAEREYEECLLKAAGILEAIYPVKQASIENT